jgi:hypothetical protein
MAKRKTSDRPAEQEHSSARSVRVLQYAVSCPAALGWLTNGFSKKLEKPRTCGCAVLYALQLLPSPQHTASHARDAVRNQRSRLES